MNLSPIYQVYSDLEEIDSDSVETEEDEEMYYNSLLWGCKNCDLIKDNRMFMTFHFCSNNGKSRYHEHQQEFINKKLERMNEKGKWG